MCVKYVFMNQVLVIKMATMIFSFSSSSLDCYLQSRTNHRCHFRIHLHFAVVSCSVVRGACFSFEVPSFCQQVADSIRSLSRHSSAFHQSCPVFHWSLYFVLLQPLPVLQDSCLHSVDSSRSVNLLEPGRNHSSFDAWVNHCLDTLHIRYACCSWCSEKAACCSSEQMDSSKLFAALLNLLDLSVFQSRLDHSPVLFHLRQRLSSDWCLPFVMGVLSLTGYFYDAKPVHPSWRGSRQYWMTYCCHWLLSYHSRYSRCFQRIQQYSQSLNRLSVFCESWQQRSQSGALSSNPWGWTEAVWVLSHQIQCCCYHQQCLGLNHYDCYEWHGLHIQVLMVIDPGQVML